MPEAITEALVVLVMFVIRIGVPIAITLAIGYWLEKMLQPHAEPSEESKPIELLQRDAKSNKIIRIRCWDVKRCPPARRAACAAARRPEVPCWLALQIEGGEVRQDCFTCALYKPRCEAA